MSIYSLFAKTINNMMSSEKKSVDPLKLDVVTTTEDDFVLVDDLNKDLHDFHLVEKLGHSSDIGAYGAPKRKEGDTLSISDPANNISVPYQVVKIKTCSTGLVGEIFVPVDANQSQKIYINWTGTHSKGTVLADLEKAPGEESYRDEEIEILSQINSALQTFTEKTPLKADIVVSGHSLGGALAQQNWHSIQRALATNIYERNLTESNSEKEVSACTQWLKAEQAYRVSMGTHGKHIGMDLPQKSRSHLHAGSIHSLTLGVWNSAGVLKAIDTHSNQLAPVLNQAGVKQRALFGMVGGDAVQTTGQGSVLSHVSHEVAEVSLLKVNKHCEGYDAQKIIGMIGGAGIALTGCMALSPVAVLGGGLAGGVVGLLPFAHSTKKAHTAKHFPNQTLNETNSQLYKNNTPEDSEIIRKKLTNKSRVLQWAPVRFIQQGLYAGLECIVEKRKNRP